MTTTTGMTMGTIIMGTGMGMVLGRVGWRRSDGRTAVGSFSRSF